MYKGKVVINNKLRKLNIISSFNFFYGIIFQAIANTLVSLTFDHVYMI